MKPIIETLGKVVPTVEGDWNIKNKYSEISIVFDEQSNKSYISKKEVPAGISILNKEYWHCFGNTRIDSDSIILLSRIENGIITSYTLEEAIKSISIEDRRIGMFISFYEKPTDELLNYRWNLYQFNSNTVDDFLDITAWTSIYYPKTKFYGLFANEEDLYNAKKNPSTGDYAFVGNSIGEANVYVCRIKNVWTSTTEKASEFITIIVKGNVTVGKNGNWFNNGIDTGISAKGEKGDKPYIRYNSNTDNIEYSFDNMNWDIIISRENIIGPAATIEIGSVITVSTTTPASVTNSGTKGEAILDFKIPKGETGATGEKGDTGNGLLISGYKDDVDSLPTTTKIGEAWLVGTQTPYNLYIWSGTEWKDNGPINEAQIVLNDNFGDSSTSSMTQRAVTKNVGLDEYEIFSEEKDYNIGDIVNYNGNLKEFTVAHTAGAWIGTDVKDISVKKELNNKINKINNNFLLNHSITSVPAIDYSHVCSISESGVFTNYLENNEYDVAWILINSTGKLKLSGATFKRAIFFSDIIPSVSAFIKYETSEFQNMIIPNNAKLCLVNMFKSENSEGYINLRAYQDNSNISIYNTMKLSAKSAKGIYIDLNHLCSIDIEGNFSEYSEDDNYDSLWVKILNGVNQLNAINCTITRFIYFSDTKPNKNNFISHNKTGIVPDNAVLCIINLKHEDNLNGYEDSDVIQTFNFVNKTRFDNLFSSYIKDIPLGKNYINANNLLLGYSLQSGQLIENGDGIMSNKIYLENGITYTMQGIYFYGTANAIFIAYFGDNDVYLGRGQFNATFEEGEHYGKATFTFDNPNEKIKYVRICLQTTSSYPFNKEIAQLEVGSEATTVEEYIGEEKLELSSEKQENLKKKIRILSIGNSYSQDALSYIPFILPKIEEDLDIEIGILYMSGATLQQHYNNFIGEISAYTYYLFNGGISWQNLGSYTIQKALSSQNWDIILLQQGSTSSWDWGTYQPYLNNIVSLIYKNIDYPIKFGWMLTQSRPKVNDTIYTDEEILEHFISISENSKKVLNETLCDFILPVGTAVQNARTTNLNEIGDYGKLCSSDGGHLQEGLPSQLAAYTCILSILKITGYEFKSIYGENTRVTVDWTSNKNIPGPNGSAVGSTDENCIIAQKCAIMAIKNPYNITDCSNL